MPNNSSRRSDLTNQRFTRLVALYFHSLEGRKAKWFCACDCGNTLPVRADSLLNGHARSCGCLQRETAAALGKSFITHGMRHTPEYNIWCHIKQRCYNPKNKKFKYWGGRGVTMCERWRSSFENFFADMGPRPSDRQTIDRIDNDIGYSKENCRWATWSEQRLNQRRMKQTTQVPPT